MSLNTFYACSFQVRIAMEKIRNLVKNAKNVTTLQPFDSMLPPRIISLKDGSEIRIKGADKQEIKAVENMIWLAAWDGEGFCLDEFCPEDGHFLHKFILDPKVVIATDHHGNVAHATLFAFHLVVLL